MTFLPSPQLGLPLLFALATCTLIPRESGTTHGSSAENPAPLRLSREEVQAGWIELFDGESLFGWRNEGDANFRVENREIIADQGSAPCLLRTTSQFDEYHLRVEFYAEAETNSGVFLRTSPRPTNPTDDCIEVNIATSALSPFATGALVAREPTDSKIETGVWHRFDLLVEHDRIVSQVDGREIASLGNVRPQGRGFIGLQYNSGPIRFRNIFLRPLKLDAITCDPADPFWRPVHGQALVVEPSADNSLRLKGGPGHLESRDEFADFVLQLEAKTRGIDVNSGVFFRCQPDSQLDGYETQISHQTVDGAPNTPKDFGTGGIFRRQEARFLETKDEEWFSLTIVAEGPHFATWVNGRQVVDWRDERPAHPNPRRGRRVEAGTLALQAHDPSTDIEFRSLRASELGPRSR